MKTTKSVSFTDTSVAFSAKNNYRLFKMFLLFGSMNFNRLVKIGNNLISFLFRNKFPIKGLIKHTVFQQFCGGETIDESEETITELAVFNIGTILDYSVEGKKSEKGFNETAEEIVRTVKKSDENDDIPFSVFKLTGIGDADLLAKIQAKETLSQIEISGYERIKERVNRICQKAYQCNTKVLIDGEESWIQNTIDELAYEMMSLYNKDQAIVYNTYQMYRKDMLQNLKTAFADIQGEDVVLGAKLVRGAYMEKERERALAMGYESPIQPDKEATDRDFNLALKFCVENHPSIGLCCGTHNEYSNAYLAELMKEKSIAPDDTMVYFAQLYGMSDNISFNLAKAGYNVSKYVPYGPVHAVLPYLFRRSQENSSVAGQTSREYRYVKKEIKRRIMSKP